MARAIAVSSCSVPEPLGKGNELARHPRAALRRSPRHRDAARRAERRGAHDAPVAPVLRPRQKHSVVRTAHASDGTSPAPAQSTRSPSVARPSRRPPSGEAEGRSITARRTWYFRGRLPGSRRREPDRRLRGRVRSAAPPAGSCRPSRSTWSRRARRPVRAARRAAVRRSRRARAGCTAARGDGCRRRSVGAGSCP